MSFGQVVLASTHLLDPGQIGQNKNNIDSCTRITAVQTFNHSAPVNTQAEVILTIKQKHHWQLNVVPARTQLNHPSIHHCPSAVS